MVSNKYTPRSRVMQHTQAAFWCSLREEQATSLKNTERNPARDPPQKEMERSLFIKTTMIQATGCNFRFPRRQWPQSNDLLHSDIIRKKMVSSVLERCEVFYIPFLDTKFYIVLSFLWPFFTFNGQLEASDYSQLSGFGGHVDRP